MTFFAETKSLPSGIKCVLQTQESVVSLQLFSGITQVSLIISWMTNYSLILARNFSINFSFCRGVPSFQCQDDVEVLNVMNEDVRALKDALENRKNTKKRIKKDSYRYFDKKFKNL